MIDPDDPLIQRLMEDANLVLRRRTANAVTSTADATVWDEKTWPPPRDITPEVVFTVLWTRIEALEAEVRELHKHQHQVYIHDTDSQGTRTTRPIGMASKRF